jgi:hypothetical protein
VLAAEKKWQERHLKELIREHLNSKE